jgi:hypothetical protein
MSANILFKNKEYDGVRFTYTRLAFPSGTVVDTTYAEGSGNRYYYSILSGTASPDMEAATFESFISFTMSGAVTHFVDLVPMEPGESVYFDITATATNTGVTGGFFANPRAGYIHTGSEIKPIGGTAGITYDIRTDFPTMGIGFIINATASIALGVTCITGQTLDWDIFINYKKGYRAIVTPPGPTPPRPIYPTS